MVSGLKWGKSKLFLMISVYPKSYLTEKSVFHKPGERVHSRHPANVSADPALSSIAYRRHILSTEVFLNLFWLFSNIFILRFSTARFLFIYHVTNIYEPLPYAKPCAFEPPQEGSKGDGCYFFPHKIYNRYYLILSWQHYEGGTIIISIL